MSKDKNTWILILVIVGVIVVFGMFYQNYSPTTYPKFVISGNEVISRTLPTMVNQGGSISLIYTASNTAGTWGATIMDVVSGGCTFPGGGTTYQALMLSTSGNTKTVTLTAPSSKANCILSTSGNYQFGEATIKNFVSQTVQVCTPICTRPANQCTESSTVNNGCTGYCTGSSCLCTGSWTVTKNTPADIDCSNVVTDTELVAYGNSWISGSVTRAQLATAIVAWIGTG